MNEFKMIPHLKALLYLLIVIRFAESQMAKMYYRQNHESKGSQEKVDLSLKKHVRPLDRLLIRLGGNSTREPIFKPDNVIDFRSDPKSLMREAPTQNSLFANHYLRESHTKRSHRISSSLSGRVTRENLFRDKKKKRLNEDRSSEPANSYPDVEEIDIPSAEDDDERDPSEEEYIKDYQDLEPKYESSESQNNLRHKQMRISGRLKEPIRGQQIHQAMPETTKSRLDLQGIHAFQQLQMNSVDNSKARVDQHIRKMLRHGLCKVPQQRLIKVSEIYPSMSKKYSPSCTFLFRCSEDTGCCPQATQKCVAKRSELVELYFQTTNMEFEEDGRKKGVVESTEKLVFSNDTECHCHEMMPRDDTNAHMTQLPTCNCPSGFTGRYNENESCICDCFDKQRPCIDFKKGQKSFSTEDRLCIAEGKCKKPLCSYGIYSQKLGRCPERLRRKNLKYHKEYKKA